MMIFLTKKMFQLMMMKIQDTEPEEEEDDDDDEEMSSDKLDKTDLVVQNSKTKKMRWMMKKNQTPNRESGKETPVDTRPKMEGIYKESTS